MRVAWEGRSWVWCWGCCAGLSVGSRAGWRAGVWGWPGGLGEPHSLGLGLGAEIAEGEASAAGMGHDMTHVRFREFYGVAEYEYRSSRGSGLTMHDILFRVHYGDSNGGFVLLAF